MRRFLRNNALSLVVCACFLVIWLVGQSWSGMRTYNMERREDNEAAIGKISAESMQGLAEPRLTHAADYVGWSSGRTVLADDDGPPFTWTEIFGQQEIRPRLHLGPHVNNHLVSGPAGILEFREEATARIQVSLGNAKLADEIVPERFTQPRRGLTPGIGRPDTLKVAPEKLGAGILGPPTQFLGVVLHFQELAALSFIGVALRGRLMGLKRPRCLRCAGWQL